MLGNIIPGKKFLLSCKLTFQQKEIKNKQKYVIAGGDKHCKEQWRPGVWETGDGATGFHADARRPLWRGDDNISLQKGKAHTMWIPGHVSLTEGAASTEALGGVRTKELYSLGFPGGSDGKESAGSGRPGFNPWVWKIPWRRAWQPTPLFLPGESPGQRSLAGYSPWGCKELDMIY